MISVQLLAGDLSVGADGTVTAVDGDRVYAFGHRFLASGPTEMPFAQAEVLALLPNLNSSFKISTAREWMGSITADRDTAIAGVTGRAASLIPVEIRVGANTYNMRMVRDRVMTPLLTQMAIFSSIDATERNIGTETYSIRGQIDFAGGTVRIDDVYSGDVAVAAIASGGVASTLGFALQSGFDALKIKSITLDITPVEKRGQSQILDFIAPRTARPGEDLDLVVVLGGRTGRKPPRHVRYRVPIGAAAGTALLHRCRRECHQHHRIPGGRRHAATFAGRGFEFAERPPLQHQGLRAHLAIGTVLHRGGPRSSRSSSFARHDPHARASGKHESGDRPRREARRDGGVSRSRPRSHGNENNTSRGQGIVPLDRNNRSASSRAKSRDPLLAVGHVPLRSCCGAHRHRNRSRKPPRLPFGS